jgi:hypothetical protein
MHPRLWLLDPTTLPQQCQMRWRPLHPASNLRSRSRTGVRHASGFTSVPGAAMSVLKRFGNCSVHQTCGNLDVGSDGVSHAVLHGICCRMCPFFCEYRRWTGQEQRFSPLQERAECQALAGVRPHATRRCRKVITSAGSRSVYLASVGFACSLAVSDVGF